MPEDPYHAASATISGARNRRLTIFAARLLMASLLLTGCRSKDGLPKPGTAPYLEFTNAFYIGLAALQVGDDVRAETSLAASTHLAPGEPAAWANYGVLALRQRTYDAAFDRLSRAHTLAPTSDRIDYLLGLLESERGNPTASIPYLEQAVQANPTNLRALYQLASEVDRQGGPTSDQRFQQLVQQILTAQPQNLAAQLELARIAAKRNDTATLKAAVARIAAASKTASPAWPAEVLEQLTALQSVANGPEPRSAATRSIFLRNVLMRVPEFRTSLSDLKPQPGEGAQPLTQLLRLPNPPATPAPADQTLRFTPQPQPAPAQPYTWSSTLSLNGADAPILAHANASTLELATGATLPFPGGNASAALTPESVLPIDLNFDFKTDLVLAGPAGVRLFRQEDPAHFTDVTAQSKLPASILNAPYTGAWAVDIEADGDLDILLGSLSGPPTLLRNNGDSTFTPATPFPHISGLRQLTWVDLNGDGNPDAALIDRAGRLHLFLNQRSGNFTEAPIPTLPGETKAIAAADLGPISNNQEALNLVAVQSTGAILRLDPATLTIAPAFWSTHQIASVANPASELTGDLRLHAADLDNNGAVDLLLAPITPPTPGQVPILWLQTDTGTFESLQQPITPTRIFDLADLHSDGHLASVGLTEAGSPAVSSTLGTKKYHWQTIRPRARQSTGDQRINSFGIGGEIEIRSGLLVQKQPITRPELHFGLGTQAQSEVARILWPNGSVRAEFALKADQQILTEQRLKGSCPFLFAWDGTKMSFVKDSVPWGSAIGLRINALGTAKIAATEEWFKIPREQLQPRDGFYDLRVTGELWETYYYDQMSMMTVDHPAGTEVFTDERYDVPPVKLAVTAVAEPHPIASAVDDNGHDVTSTLATLDGLYLDTFGRGQYQGVTRDHFVEITLPATLPSNAYLIAKGWLHPSDSSVNVAMGQGSGAKPHWLTFEVPDANGRWHTANSNLGFPAGRNKICLIDLTNVFVPGAPHRLRLRTNLEIFWDQIQWAEALPTTPLKITHLTPETANLHYRGFSTIHQANPSSPELPDYNTLASTTPIWRDLEGFYTRFGDVRELLAHSDDRSVIMNAGDEMSLRFAAPPPPPPGWVRDFVLTGDGWIKDGDYNTSYAQNVLPYPHHDRSDYDTSPGKLEDDWVYRHHPEDFQSYQTRYITPQPFLSALHTDGDPNLQQSSLATNGSTTQSDHTLRSGRPARSGPVRQDQPSRSTAAQ